MASPPRKLYKTGEVIREAGISRGMLYYYTHLGLVTEVERTPAGHRLYDEDVFRKIELILDLNKSGYPLRDIRDIFIAGNYRRRELENRSTPRGGKKSR